MATPLISVARRDELEVLVDPARIEVRVVHSGDDGPGLVLDRHQARWLMLLGLPAAAAKLRLTESRFRPNAGGR